ncbi:hypothetical protein [Microbulbifer sp. 2205BS26-8]|uniref:hypothetical protein n=1 Tax=Microbulbifer sp. 2205BS26-8 TaxID=3064386 RepID=UPI00273ED286|nr:hypothetical protein [Microbulbifer sp. 2205BS26-8]MDP5208948.1 hypothetical protein [Microbulbifer sp. 2205BS26-8]
MKQVPSRFRPKLASLATLLLLMFQVQAVLACEMMDRPAPGAACCCDHTVADSEPPMDCCEYEAQVSLKTPLDGHQAALTTAPLTPELPQFAPPPTYQWPQILAPPAPTRVTGLLSHLPYPANRTWLDTLRLRI